MTGRDLAFIGCRLLALYLGITATYQAISIGFAWEGINRSVGVDRDELNMFSIYALPPITHVAIAVLLWIGARYLARHVAPSPVNNEKTNSLTRAEVESVAFAAVGMFLLLGAIPELLVVIHRYATLDEQAGQFSAANGTGERLATATLRAAVGGLLLMYPHFDRLRRWLRRDAFD